MAGLDLMGLLQGTVNVLGNDADTSSPPVEGVTIGVVTDLDDPQGLGRVKVRLPFYSHCVESAWARIASPWAGQRRGSYLLPEVDDEVLIAFRHGDLTYPYVIGTLWNEKDPPPERSPALHRRELRSGKGHLLAFDDTDGHERLTVRSQGGLEVTLDDATGQVRISGPGSPALRIVVDTKNARISIIAPTGDLSLEAPQGEIALDARSIRVQASAGLTLSGQPVHINPPAPALPSISEGVA
ncbi:phage baseplate assembly protein V [Actinoplanes sp. NPDC026623]|uniref:phage baseplate assembly protein V n=1 Tax=Actinoplanes sp. NPDC026623 TaxID=3155610 RepID=UPI0033CB2385